MRVRIYQINPDRDVNRVKHERLSHLERLQGSPDVQASIYDEVFSAEIDFAGLEQLYTQFNTTGHPLHRGGQMQVSDIVVTDEGAFYCDRFGFAAVAFDVSRTQKPDNLMTVVYVEPGRPAYVAEVLQDLHAEQRAVAGERIDYLDNGDGTLIINNEDSKDMGLPGNRRYGQGQVIAGPFFVVGDSGDKFRSLTESEVTKYMARFAEPEDISPEEVEADHFIAFYSM